MGPILDSLRGSRSATRVLDQLMSCPPGHPFRGSCPQAGRTLLTARCIPILCYRDSLHIQSALPLAPEAQFQKLLPLRLNQRNLGLGLSAQENLVTLADASPSFCPELVFLAQLGGWPAALNLFLLPSSGLKSPEGVWPDRLWQPEGERTSSGPAGFLLCQQSPVQPFCLWWAFLHNSVKNSVCLGLFGVT